MAKSWIAGALVTTVLLAGCGASSGSDGADEPTTTKAPAASTTTTTEVDTSEAAADYQAAIESVSTSIGDEIDTRDGFAGESDLDGAIDSTRDLRNDLFDFDATVRALHLPADEQSAANDVLTETGRYIAALDDYQQITGVAGYNDQLDVEAAARTAWYEAVNALADDLDVDGIENELDDTGSTSSSSSGSETETVEAGDVLETATVSMEVPEGFSGEASFPIELTNEDDALVGVYNVYNDEADTLEEVAEASAEGAAEKNGFEIIGDHEELTVGEYDALGWVYDDGQGNTIVDIYFEAEDAAGDRWHVLAVEAPEADIDAVMASVEEILDSVQVAS